jgi:hypothetical protein
MPQALSQLLIEMRKNTRLRFGLWFIIAILITYVILVLNDYQVELKRDYQNALTRLNQLQALAQQTQWPERALQVQDLRTQLEARLWQANTKGLAQAIFQSWLQEEMFFAQVKQPRLKVENAVEVPKNPNLWRVSAELKGIFVQKRFYSLLLEIAKSPRTIVTERLDIRQSSPPRFTLVLVAYFKKNEQ